MLQLKNTTPFIANISVFPNEQGIDTLYIVLKATFELGATPAIAAQQCPVTMADEYWGEPGQSSLKYGTDLHLTKPSTDIIVLGEACAPGRKPVERLEVSLKVGRYGKVVRVFGDRYWIRGLVGMRITPPKPFETMPLMYERSFGGMHEVDPEKNIILFEPRNPVGKGFIGKRKHKEIEGMALPNLEDPSHLISKPDDTPPPACFSFIAPSWEPRKSLAGTYDEVWLKKRAPYLPDDFDSRFFNAAHPDLVCREYVKGGEQVEVLNMSPKGPLRFTLPECKVEAKVLIAEKMETPQMNLETMVIEPGDGRLTLLWRAAVVCDKKALKVKEVEVSMRNFDFFRKEAA